MGANGKPGLSHIYQDASFGSKFQQKAKAPGLRGSEDRMRSMEHGDLLILFVWTLDLRHEESLEEPHRAAAEKMVADLNNRVSVAAL